jgi:hypothetical protein
MSRYVPLLHFVLASIGSAQTRHSWPILGSICAKRPTMRTCNAQIVACASPTNLNHIPIHDGKQYLYIFDLNQCLQLQGRILHKVNTIGSVDLQLQLQLQLQCGVWVNFITYRTNTTCTYCKQFAVTQLHPIDRVANRTQVILLEDCLRALDEICTLSLCWLVTLVSAVVDRDYTRHAVHLP